MRAIRIVIILLLFNGPQKYFSQEEARWSYKNSDQYLDISDKLLDSIFENAKFFLETKYVYGGSSNSGFDCSGFIYFLFKEYDILLSKSSSQLSKVGKHVAFSDIRKGDLLFFKGRNMVSENVGHVALVICSSENSFEMIHATNRGVVIDQYDEISYYQKRYLFAKRFLNIDPAVQL